MAVDESSDPLARATEALRSEDDGAWTELSRTILERVRTLVVPAESVISFNDEGETERGARGSTIRVSTRVLVPALRHDLETPSRATDAIEVVVTDDRCVAVKIDLVGVYGADLQAEGDEVRRAVSEVLRSALGPDPDFDADRDIQVSFVDVVTQDPHRQ
ncbi:MAG: hypothetical protein EON52_08520 [Actinomycetales bacterium]|nr:MAG: hypothetical protein EON52_08520 [Actinomycetales bacterium]